MLPKRRLLISSLGLVTVLGVLAVGYAVLSRQVGRALAEDGATRAALTFTALPATPAAGERWGGAEVAAVVVGSERLLTAGAFGVLEGGADIGAGLPTLKAAALTLWRGRPVLGLEAGGLFLRREGHWEEFRSGFGALHARTLVEGPGGELFIGAQEGLFKAAWGAAQLERLDRAPVRSLALAEGGVWLAGGEQGLSRLDGGRVTRLATPDPWIEFVGCQGSELVVLTAQGLCHGPLGGELQALSGEEVRAAAVDGTRTFAVSGPLLLRFEASGRPAEERLPAIPRRVFAVAGNLFVDTAAGLYRRGAEGWTLAQARPASLPAGPSHVSALAALQSRVAVGLFDGGMALSGSAPGPLTWNPVPGSEVWGVNALLPAGGALYVASLRGAARFDGQRLTAIEGAGGAAFALAATRDGVAIGYGQGVLLPGARMLSAFHGLPGNQALALAAGDELFVGTPSGLGAIDQGRVSWRVTGGEGKLPHPWITALALLGDQLFVGTYGGGVVRRSPAPGRRPVSGSFLDFPETQGFRVNPGCLVAAGGRLYLGTEGRGLYRLSADGQRFRPLRATLPSPRVTAILSVGDSLFVGTDEGLARIPLTLLEEGD